MASPVLGSLIDQKSPATRNAQTQWNRGDQFRASRGTRFSGTGPFSVVIILSSTKAKRKSRIHMVMMPEWNEVTYQRSSQLDTRLGKMGLLMLAYVGFKTTYKSCDFIPMFFLSPFWVLINYFLFFFFSKNPKRKY